MITAFLILIGGLWLLITGTILYLFVKYRNLKTRYMRLGEETVENAGNSPSSGVPGEIEMQTRSESVL
jgi:hypothetical protein